MKMEQSNCVDTSKDISTPLVIEHDDVISISKQISEEFDIYDVPFLECNYDDIYPDVASVLPKEAVSFYELSLEYCIACEVICAAICHQMNWDFLRQVVLEKTRDDMLWVSGNRLLSITEIDISVMFCNYGKPERIKARERCEILHEVGKMVCEVGSYQRLFLNEQMNLLSIDKIRSNLLRCSAFYKDPKEKKLQLLLQKLSVYERLEELAVYCKPAIDYHLIRCYLRRGLIYPRTKYATEFIYASSIQRKEATVGALRQLCSELLEQISWYTELDICTVNSIEWNIGRSICTQDNPDCYLKTKDAAWLKEKYTRCPFYENCRAQQNEKDDMLYINEPEYRGTSY